MKIRQKLPLCHQRKCQATKLSLPNAVSQNVRDLVFLFTGQSFVPSTRVKWLSRRTRQIQLSPSILLSRYSPSTPTLPNPATFPTPHFYSPTHKQTKEKRFVLSYRDCCNPGAGIARWLERRTRDRKVLVFESRQERRESFLLQSWLSVLTLTHCPFHPVLLQWQVKDPGHSSKSAGSRW